jgi:hypothetical protein
MSTSKPMTDEALRVLESSCGHQQMSEVRRLFDKAKKDLDTLVQMNPKFDAKYRTAFVEACRRITDEARKTVGTHKVADSFRREES